MTAKLTDLLSRAASRAAAGLGAAASRTVEGGTVEGTAEQTVERPIDARAYADIEAWLALLLEWNARIDLTAARTPEELVDLMVADALVLAPRLAQGARVVDVGTGAGAPGLCLALLPRDLEVTLVEPLGKRASFLRTVLGTLRRADVRIERARGEALAGRGAWDVAVSRATLPPARWLDLATTLARPGGTAWVLVATEPPPTHARAVLETDLPYAWPLTGAPRRALGYRVLEEAAFLATPGPP